MLPPKLPDKSSYDWQSIPESQRQLYIQQLRTNSQLQPQIINNLSAQQQQKKKTTRKKGRSKGSSEDASFSEDELDPIEDIPSDAPRRSVRTRARNTYAEDESENEGNNPNPAPAQTHNQKGPTIDKILGKTVPQPGGQQLLCKLPGQAFSHSQYYSDSQIQSNPDNAQILSKYNSMQDSQDSVLSDVTPFISEPIFNRTSVDCFIIDHILDHRQQGEANTVPLEAFDSTHYIPGYPFKQTPNFENILAYEKPLRPPDGFSNSILDEYGIINLRGDDTVNNLTNDEEEEEEELAPIERPANPEYLIKWRGSNSPTWEDSSTLAGVGEELFHAANYEEFNNLADIYWQNLIQRRKNRKNAIDQIQSFPLMERGIELTSKQKDTINRIIESKNNKDLKISLTENGSGRVGAALSFLHLIKKLQNYKVTALIIVDKYLVPVYSAGLRVMTSLSYSEFKDDVESRAVVRQHQLLKEYGPSIDALLVSKDVFDLEGASLANIKWNYIIVDSLNPPNLSSFAAPFKIVIENRSETTTDFSYTEHAFFVSNAISGQIHDRLSKLMKLRNSRSHILADPCQLYLEMTKSHIHPFLIGPMEDIIIQKFKMRFNITVLSQEQHSDLFSSSSAKVTHLTDLIDNSKITIVVCDNHSMLRLLMSHMEKKNIKSAIINSPIREEQFPDRFHSGVIFMTRDFSSPRLTNIVPSKIIFFDIGQSILLDNSLVRFFSRKNQNVEVYRMVTDNSLEAILYSKYISDFKFNYQNISMEEMEIYLRVEAITTQPTINPLSIVNHDKMDFKMPFDKKCFEIFGKLLDKVNEPDFWDTVFSHRRVQNIKTVTWKRSDAVKVLEYMESKGFCDFEEIATQMGKQQDEVYTFARAVFLQFMTTIDKQSLVHYNLANAILWYEYYTTPFTDQFDEGPSFWQELSADEPTLQTPVFTKPVFARQINQRMKSILERIEEVWIIQTFLKLHEEPYLPPRYFETPSHFLFEFLRAYLDSGANYAELAKRMTNFRTVDKDIAAKISVPIVNAITSDVLSIAMHAKENDYANDRFMKPIILACRNGPFSKEWSNKEVSIVMQVAGNNYIPQCNGMNDWAEFRAIGRLIMKSQDMIQPFFMSFDECLRKPKRPDDTVLITPEMRNCPMDSGSLPLAKNIVDNYRMITNQLKHIRTLATEGIKHFIRSGDLPEKWDAECDYALVTGVVQFGFQAREKLGRIVPHSSPNYLDIPMARPLADFQYYLGQQGKCLKRLQFVIMNNVPIKRHISFFETAIHRVEFQFPDYQKIAYEKMLQMQRAHQQIQLLKDQNPNIFKIIPSGHKTAKQETKPAPPPASKTQKQTAPPPPIQPIAPIPPPPPPPPPPPQENESSIFGISPDFFAELQKTSLPPPPPPPSSSSNSNSFRGPDVPNSSFNFQPPPQAPRLPTPPVIPAQSMFALALRFPPPPPPPQPSPQQSMSPQVASKIPANMGGKSTSSKIPANIGTFPPPPPPQPVNNNDNDNMPSIFGIDSSDLPPFLPAPLPIDDKNRSPLNSKFPNQDLPKKMVFLP
ncbi:hypothetical protein TVAG_228810 [Trichomonas vaginalis G3]|uniref:Chromo domain-containing protein n=1 Tax=Trichomonas vaginalis (strain ATCC PRA-98 / G3) TaxID=412133 RepID=A2DJ43_TRIV3|nr:formin-related family [Trichomonas vaginalis G3]EAY19618.1 hypothetical protein TVAG_228810 [Trichomonas vaginalis G3]KAI5515058.1 formin-related family [Trichomonas vaginalis G3]|eukprot:XP_001580604.1 hypothetical protein [Trichomonas vaginalis G3]